MTLPVTLAPLTGVHVSKKRDIGLCHENSSSLAKRSDDFKTPDNKLLYSYVGDYEFGDFFSILFFCKRLSGMSVKRGLGVEVGVFFSFSFFFNFFSSFFPFVLFFFCCFFFLYDNNGNTQRLGTNREIRAEYHGMPCFHSFFPLKWSRDKPSLFTRWKDELNHERHRGCSFLFKNLLVKGTIIAACMFCFLSFLGRV